MEHPFTKIIDLLFSARQKGIEVILNDERLQLKTGDNVEIDEQLLNDIRLNKQSIIEYLSGNGWKAVSVNGHHKKINAAGRTGLQHIPASFSQERLWFIDHLSGSVEYHSPTILRLTGQPDKAALAITLQTIIQRHEVLRTVFYEKDGQVYQSVREGDSWEMSFEDGTAYQNNPECLKLHIEQLVKAPFNLAADFPIRSTLISLTAQEYILVVTLHHIASDAWSTGIMVNEFAELYNALTEGRQPQLATLPLQYADFTLWQRAYLKGEVLDKKTAYWQNKLQGHQNLQLPTSYSRQGNQPIQGASANFSIDKNTTARLRELAQKEGASLYMALLAAFKILLSRYSGQQDITVGTSIASRQQKELEGLIGFFVNTLALRDQVSPDATFTQLLLQVKETTLGAYEHQDIPFEKVVEVAVKERDPERNPLFQVMLVLANTPEAGRLRLGNMELARENFAANISKFELTFFISENNNSLVGHIDYRTDLFEAAAMNRMAAHFVQLLASITANPTQPVSLLPIISTGEERQLLQDFNNSEVTYPADTSVVDLFEQQAAKNPEETAVVFEGKSLTYRQLNEQANQVAHSLISKGIVPGAMVPLYVQRSAEMIVGMLGIMKAGAAYVPIDVDFPADRISYMLADTGAAIVVSTSFTHRKTDVTDDIAFLEIDIVSNQPKDNITLKPQPHHLTYVIYTSGSTGQPKGVMVEHRHLVDYYYGLDKNIQISRCRSFALTSTIATDLGNTVIYGALLSGGALHVFSKESVSNAAYLHRYFTNEEIDCIKIVPSHWQALRSGDDLLLPRKLIVFGGEALPFGIVEEISHSNAACRIVNHYGPTETTIGKLLHEVNTGGSYGQNIPIGQPFSNTKVYVLNGEMQLCPAGIPGQLYIAGHGVARGYLNNETLTREKFVANPFSPADERYGTLYATGDLVKWLPDGNMEFRGRVDDQVKIRGYRVEPGEVENVLRQCESVSGAAVLAKPDKQGNTRLVAYLVPTTSFNKEAITACLKEKLPEYMVPSVLIPLENLPLTANGKIDRKALPDPDAATTSEDEYTAPRTEAEQRMAALWADVLELDEISIHNDFFESGGHSLLAVRLISAIRKAFDVEMPIGDIFDYPTVATLTARLPVQKNVTLLPAIEAIHPRPEYLPLSFSQERLWFIHQMVGSLQYHVPAVLKLSGHVNKQALEFALQRVVGRHEILRTVYLQQDGQPYQLVNDADKWQMQEIDGEAFLQDREGLRNCITQLIKKPFDLTADYMLRAALIRLGNEDQVLVVIVHHIASDGWSKSVLVNDFAAFYNSYENGSAPALPSLAIQYADYAIWLRRHIAEGILENKLNYWKNTLQDVPALPLPTDFARPALQTTNGAVAAFRVEKEILVQVQHLSQRHGATLFMTLLSVFKVLLYRYSGQTDICVGTPIAGRQQQEIEELIGFFVNTLALRTQLDGHNTFTELLQQVRAGTLAAYEHQEAPFEKVVEAVVKERDVSRSPLFQVMFVLRNTPDIPRLAMEGVQVAGAAYQHTTSLFDMTLYITEYEHGLEGSLEYNTDLFNTDTIGRILLHFTQLLRSVTSAPEQSIDVLPMLSPAEEILLLHDFNNTQQDFPADKTINGLFEEQVIQSPQAVAVVFEEKQLTYDELNTSANRLASYLINKGVTENTLIPICVERGMNMIISVLAILKTGAAYVPVDAENPDERIIYVLDDVDAKFIISTNNHISAIAAGKGYEVINPDKNSAIISRQPGGNVNVANNGTNLAYVLYTSGSTGRPKGVRMASRGLVNLLNWQQKQFANPHRRVLQFANLTFDVSFQEIFSTLCYGSQLYLIASARRKDMAMLLEDIGQLKITHLFIPYIVLKSLAEYAGTFSSGTLLLEEIIVAGEQLKVTGDISNLISSHNLKLVNQYGPTEAHVVSSFTINAQDNPAILPPIGKPVDNTCLYVLGPQQQPVPVGVAGELYIGGVQVANGYLNLPELTAERFVHDPFTKQPGNKMYKTGDLAHWLPDGNIAYLGRADDQVKVRGYRIEPGEIEAVLQQSNLINGAVVLAKDDGTGNKNLVAYVVPQQAFTRQAVIAFLQTRLPDYMVPRFWVEMKEWPLTNSGKVDKQVLSYTETSLLTTKQYEAPRNELETKLAEILQELLRVPQVGIYDNFFEIGGHSLYAIRYVWQIGKKLNLNIRVNDVFIYPTIAALAGNIVEKVQNPSLPAVNIRYLVPIKKEGYKPPLYIVAGGGGTALKVKNFAGLLDAEQPVYVFQPPIGDVELKGLPDTIEGIAALFIEELLIQNPNGPYALSGHCIGGIIAFEMAKQLQRMGKKVHSLIMFDTIIRKRVTPPPATIKNLFLIPHAVHRSFLRLKLKVDFQTFLLRKHALQSIKYKVSNFRSMRNRNKRKQLQGNNGLEYAGLEVFSESSEVYMAACRNYELVPYGGPATLFYATERYFFFDKLRNISYGKLQLDEQTKKNWNEYVTATTIYEIKGEHSDIFDPIHGREFANTLQHTLDNPQ